MISMAFRFISGRYHSSAWGTHANEAVPEWPPAPWRILRALIAAWYHKGSFIERVHPELAPFLSEHAFAALVEKLAAALPSYRVSPDTAAAHTRHYMPVGSKPVKLIDAFVHTGGPGGNGTEAPANDASPAALLAFWPLIVFWPVELEDQEKAVLRGLLRSLSYLGRAEALADADIVDLDYASLESDSKLRKQLVAPLASDADAERNREPLRLLAPESPDAFAAWLASQAPSNAKGKKAKAASILPSRIFEALQVVTSDMRSAGWSQPPGSRWVIYARPAEPFRFKPGAARGKKGESPTVVRFALVSTVPPQITKTLIITDVIHKLLCSQMPKNSDKFVFTGCDADRNPNDSVGDIAHSHAYILPECNARTGAIDYITLYARHGFDRDALRALDCLNRLDDPAFTDYCGLAKRLRGLLGTGKMAPKLVQLAAGQPEDFRNSCALFGESKTWTSITPFVPVRNPKTRKNGEAKMGEIGGLMLPIGSPAHDLVRLLHEDGNAMGKGGQIAAGSASIENVEQLRLLELNEDRSFHWLQFKTTRERGNAAEPDAHGSRTSHAFGTGLRLSFSAPVRGPIVAGYGAHFGLGLFIPSPDKP